MKKIFSFNKFFIAFCIAFILICLALQVVIYFRMIDQAKLDGAKILAWNWPDKNVKSLVQVYDAKVLKKDGNNAVIKVFADQIIERNMAESRRQEAKCAVTLSYYRASKQWYLGKVECE